jgi:hypothetical protein
MGLGELAGGLALGVVAMVVEHRVAALAGLLVAAALYGTSMQIVVYRPFARRAVQEPAAPPTAERESVTETRRRIVLMISALLVTGAALAIVSQSPALVGGIAAGNGAALLLTSRRLRGWEREHDSRLLREPRWRLRRNGGGIGRAGGAMDPRDIYVLASGDP